MKQNLFWGFAVLIALGNGACRRSNSPQSEGETHWLSACSEDSDCGDFDCVCGLCTIACSGDRTCGDERPARCFSTESPGLGPSCAGANPKATAAICLPDCDGDDACSAGLMCLKGACVAVPVTPDSKPDGGAADNGPTGPDPLDTLRASVDPRDFANTPVDIDLSRPPVRPPRVVLLPGDHPELVGTWREDCTEASVHETCATIRFWASEDGDGLVGTLELDDYEVDPEPDINGLVAASGPFPPPEDPDLGYPAGMDDSAQLQAVQHIVPAVPYALLDPYFRDGVLDTWTSPNELWNSWCELQTPHLVESPLPHYGCLPENPDQDTDPLKLVLCAWNRVSVCHCDAESCSAASHDNPFRYRMFVHDDGTATVESLNTRQTEPSVATYTKGTTR